MGFVCTIGMTSCTDTFTEINKNPLYPDSEQLDKDGVLTGSFFPTLQQAVVPVGTEGTDAINAYQINQNLAGDSWVGYMAPRNNKFNGGQSFPRFFFQEAWVNLTYQVMIQNIYVPWRGIQQNSMDGTVKNVNIFALSQIIKVAGLHRATDMFGPIPYSQVGKGNFYVAYDSQEDVYKRLLSELEEAVTVLSVYAGDKLQPKFDIVYEGDVKKWIKFANSLMLRIAMRARYADPELAKKYVTLAVTHFGGLIENNADNAKMGQGAGLQIKNPLFTIAETYNDTRMGATIGCYLEGYNDPRIAVYFQKSKLDESKEYLGVRGGLPGTNNDYNDFSLPNFKEHDPVYWMRAAEVMFLKAEAALAGLIAGDPKNLYKEGVQLSFSERGVGDASGYLNGTTSPSAYIDPKNSKNAAGAPSKSSVNWDAATTEEEKLEKIITQKYLAIYPDGHEAWSEWRRTGYPKLLIIVDNGTNAGVKTGDGHTDGVRRMIYPRVEYDNNGDNLRKALDISFNGIDLASKKLWWDAKAKN